MLTVLKYSCSRPTSKSSTRSGATVTPSTSRGFAVVDDAATDHFSARRCRPVRRNAASQKGEIAATGAGESLLAAMPTHGECGIITAMNGRRSRTYRNGAHAVTHGARDPRPGSTRGTTGPPEVTEHV